MDADKTEQLNKVLEDFLNESLKHIILSNSNEKESLTKVRIRPLLLRSRLVFQTEEFTGKQVFHKNMDASETRDYIGTMLSGRFRQAEMLSDLASASVLISKKGTVTIKVKKRQPSNLIEPEAFHNLKPDFTMLSHNRKKNYILEEGKPVPFLEDLGIMTSDGNVVKSKYDKFRQINRFLEFIEDILPRLNKEKDTTIIDFGCGKSYLTFAMYYYLHILKGYPIQVIGLDLKQDVIQRCNQLSIKYGFDRLKFYHGDIASYEGVSQVDMVVTLHACDTATDYAIAKAVRWGAQVILSVPCCQHELNKQLNNEILRPALQYGLIKERMSALFTDALRAQILEHYGYKTQILEFIDMAHTPKNILIRAVRQGERKNCEKEIKGLTEFLEVQPTLLKLLPL